MEKVRILYVLLFCLLFISCFKQYKSTSKICNHNLYVEFYEVNPAGVDAEYLTDSTNFRKYIGTIDEEHERIAYDCKGDSIYIKKFRRGDNFDSSIIEKLLEQKAVDLRVLREQHKFE